MHTTLECTTPPMKSSVLGRKETDLSLIWKVYRWRGSYLKKELKKKKNMKKGPENRRKLEPISRFPWFYYVCFCPKNRPEALLLPLPFSSTWLMVTFTK